MRVGSAPVLFAASLALGFVTLTLNQRSARAENPTHEIQKLTPPAKVGSPATVSVTVLGKNGWHVNDQAPITLALKPADGVDLPKAKLARADLSQSTPESARFDVPFSATTAGRKTIAAEARFVMCQEQACKPVKETLALEVDVTAPIAAATPPAAKRPAKK